MATNFSDFYSKIRAACSDEDVLKDGVVDTSLYIFQNATIDGALELALLDIDGFDVSGSTVTPTVSAKRDKAIIIYYTAVILLAGMVDEMTSSSNMTVRQSAPTKKLEFCATQLNRLFREKGVPAAYDGSLKDIFNHGTRFADRVSGIIG